MKGKVRIALFAMMLMLFAGSLTVYAENFGISQTKATVNIGDTVDLDITGTDKIPRWTSWNVNTVRVNQDGEVTAVRKGKTTVTARVGLFFKKCTVTVVDPTIKMNKKTATIYTGGTSTKTVQLKATPKGASKEVVWSSSNPAVATVDAKGKVTSTSAGKATITATANGESATCIVTVKESSISLNMDALQLGTKGNGSSMKLTPTVVGSKKSVNWTTSDKKVATVSGGKVTGKNSGTATITATANGISASCTVTVIRDSIAISSEKETLYVGESKQLKSNAGKKDVVTWSSSNEAVATVENGKVTAVGAGKATVCVEREGATDTCEVTVKETAISIGEDTIELRTKGTDKTYTLGYEVIGRKSTVNWTTSDKKIATVSKGKVTAKKAGTVTITATANGVSDSVQVVVKDYNPTIKLNQSEYVLYTKKGNTLTLKATVDGPNKKATWNSSDASVATVTAKGKVTALKEGTTLITATTNGITAECLITVRESKVLLETQNIHLEKGQKAELPVDVVGKSQTVKYSTTNKKVATVKNGVITAKNYGDADIKVTANGVTSICHVSVDECVHTFDEGVVTTEPTCTVEGVKTFTCIKCGDTYTETVEKAEHTWKESGRTEATCVNSGTINYICANCPETKQEFTELGEHSFGEWVTVTEATEFTEGLEKQYCANCDAENPRVIPTKEHEHAWVGVTTEPTCTEQGYNTYTCGCGESFVEVFAEALDHDWGEWVTVTEATEETEGLEKRICNRCPEEETQPIPVIGHEHSYAGVITDPTCEEKGYTTYTCECGDSYVDDYTDALDHDWSDWETVTEATEETEGLEKRTCSRCPEEETQPIPKKGHVHNYVEVVTEPTCEEQGYSTFTCACKDSYVTNYVDALGHDMGDWETVTEATEETEGLEKRTCSRCPEEETQPIPKKGHAHNYVEVVTEPTCEEQGYSTFTCSCGDSYVTNYVDATGHNYNTTIVTDPTCEEQGYTTHTCICGDYYVDTYVTHLGHDWGGWFVSKEPTVDEEGEEKNVCKRCTKVETRPIPKHEHSYNAVVTKPTCTEQGYTTHTCTCGDSFVDTYVDATGHNHIAVVTEPTCTEQGYTTYTCICGDSFVDTYVDATGHNHTAVVTEPTCTEQGYTTHTCICGDAYVDTYTDATGHDEGEWVTVKEPELGVAGSKELQCTKCGYAHETEEIEMLLTDGVDSVYYFTVKGDDGVKYQEIAIGHYDEEQAQEMLTLINNYRESINMPIFDMTNDYLLEYTALRAVETSYLWDHERPSKLALKYAENIAYSNITSSGSTASVETIFNKWIESEGHRKNIEANRVNNRTAIKVFYKKTPVIGVEGKFIYQAFWVEIFS